MSTVTRSDFILVAQITEIGGGPAQRGAKMIVCVSTNRRTEKIAYRGTEETGHVRKSTALSL